ncbi:MAG: hypothetical protein ACKOQ6_08465, partial [Bacteroidota bacterium]
MLSRIIRHLREGTWAEGLSIRINRWLDPHIRSVSKKARMNKGIHRFDIHDHDEAVDFLSSQAVLWKNKKPGAVLLAGDANDNLFRSIYLELKKRGLTVFHFHGKGSDHVMHSIQGSYCCIVSAFFNARDNHDLLSRIFGDEELKDIPFEYVGDALTDYDAVKRHNI